MTPNTARSIARDCHLWALPPKRDQLQRLYREGLGLLCEEEWQRYQAMRHPLAARRFVLGRCLLRKALAQHLGTGPEELRFGYQSKGKPVISHPKAANLCFNLSHSNEAACVAIAECCSVGIDIEALSRRARILRIAEHYFPPFERLQITSATGDAEDASLKLWVLKESVIKAVGESVWDAVRSVCLDLSGPNLDWYLPPPAGTEETWAVMIGSFRRRYLLALALYSASGWSGKSLRIHSHVLGQDEIPGVFFSPKMGTRYPIVRQAFL